MNTRRSLFEKLSPALAFAALVAIMTAIGCVALAVRSLAQEGAPPDSGPVHFQIEVRRGGAKQGLILESFFATEAGGGAEHALSIEKMVERDLKFSGWFDVRRRPGANATLAEQAAPLTGVAIITGQVSPGKRSFVLDGLLSEPRAGHKIASFDYDFEAATVASTAHRYSDDIIYQLTGQKGIARTRIGFVGKSKDGQELYTIDYDGENLQRVTSDKSIIVSPDWSPDGGAILYTSFKRGNPSVFWIRPDGTEGGAVAQHPGLNSAPSWASDGKRIAVALSKDGNQEIYTMRRDATALTRLTVNKAIDTSPSWSSTGRQIVFTSDRTGSPQLYIMDADGANTRRVTFEGDYNASPAWSPDGRSIVYVSRTSGGFDLYILDPVSQVTTPVTRGNYMYEDPAWAPDGMHIVATRSGRGVRSIVVMNYDGSEERVIPTGGLDAFSPTWSPRFE